MSCCAMFGAPIPNKKHPPMCVFPSAPSKIPSGSRRGAQPGQAGDAFDDEGRVPFQVPHVGGGLEWDWPLERSFGPSRRDRAPGVSRTWRPVLRGPKKVVTFDLMSGARDKTYPW